MNYQCNVPVINLYATGIRIRELRRERHLRVRDIQEFLGLESEQAIYKWQRGECLPSVDNLYALGELFQVRVDDILVGTRICCGEAETASPSVIYRSELRAS